MATDSSPITIGSLAEPVGQVSPAIPVSEVKQLIAEDKPISAVVVVERGRPVGLVMSLHLDRVLSQRYGFSVFYNRPVRKVMDDAPMIVAHDAMLDAVARRAMAREKSKLYDHIIVTRDRVLAGIVSVRKILEALADLQGERTEALNRYSLRLEEEASQRKVAYEALQQSRKMLQLVIDSIPHAVFWKDRDLRYLGCNVRFARNAGFASPEQLIGLTDRDFPWKEEEAAFYRQCDMEVMAQARDDGCIRETQCQFDGRQHMLDTYKFPLHDAKGEVVGILGYYEDVTKRVQSEAEHQALEQRLVRAQKMEAIGRLAGGVAHDLNNILSGIVNYPELLLLDLDSASPLRKPIQTIQKSGERAAAIVQDLLTLARRGVAVEKTLNLDTLIGEYLESPEHQSLMAAHPACRLVSRIDAGLMAISGSEAHLAKTVMNLVVNALEAMPRGGTVHLLAENRYVSRPIQGYDTVNEGDYVTLVVSDTGVGIAREDIEKVHPVKAYLVS